MEENIDLDEDTFAEYLEVQRENVDKQYLIGAIDEDEWAKIQEILNQSEKEGYDLREATTIEEYL